MTKIILARHGETAWNVEEVFRGTMDVELNETGLRQAELLGEYLRDENNPKPQVILLDLNMPKMGGIEFMKIVKADDRLKGIPVVILTTSKAEQDRVMTFHLGAAGYIMKPLEHEDFITMMEKIHQYWEMTLFPDGD